MSDTDLLVVRSLRKDYVSRSETLTVLSDVSFSLPAGKTLVVSGESGCGKTTLLNLIGGLDQPTSGTVALEGCDVSGMDEEEMSAFRSRRLGFIFQFHYLLKDFNALENVMMPARIAGSSRNAARSRARELLEDVGLGARARHYPPELSGGERQRVAVARALMNDPQLILADEPTGNLDERNASAVADLLFAMMERAAKAMVLVTHQVALRLRGDRRLLLEKGVLREAAE
jgi:lipoprotein-releasing system ATP-binding protein